MEIHQVSAKQGWQWIISGFYLFRKTPMVWILLCFTMILVAMVMVLVPFLLGNFIFTLIFPAFLAGIMLGCRDMEQGKPLEITHLFSAFKTNAAPLITVGGIYLIGKVLIVGLVMLVGGDTMVDMWLHGKRVDESQLMDVMDNILTASLIAFTLSIALMMAAWFAPMLVIFHNIPPVIAMQRSFHACLRNFIPFQVYGITLIILTALSIIPYGIGLIILMPTIFASIYVSYKDIFLGEPIYFRNHSRQENQVDDDKESAGNTTDTDSTDEPKTKEKENTTVKKDNPVQ